MEITKLTTNGVENTTKIAS